MENTTAYKIDARIDETCPDTEGYNVHDYFPGLDLALTYATPAEANTAAIEAYTGEDVDGVGCYWDVVEA